ncbi:DUF6461 domain-containing protein [Saccharothrix isguenensis]
MFPTDCHGVDPDHLLTQMLDVGFTVDQKGDDEDEDRYNEPIVRSLLLAEHITGVLPSFDALTGSWTSAHIEPWFSDARKQLAGRPGHDGPVDAFAEVQRLTDLLGPTGTPGMADALAAAERGERVTVTPDSPLGEHVRARLTEAKRLRPTSSSASCTAGSCSPGHGPHTSPARTSFTTPTTSRAEP